MILNNAPQNAAVLSNVGSVGEFRIRNSAKAFNILSSGLYANKIRAIIRELACNAVDSHRAAGRDTTPFDVHLPTQLEPWFAIRDYGTGLDHDQVANIYTTYFESTKTDSNEFIGALGLGSKSPFSYTDNFTVVAVKNGVKAIYTAYINEQGVPSIALMTSESTDEPAGVEVKFAVGNGSDFYKFRQEASTVFSYFALRPVVNISDFKIVELNYDTLDIIPGVHSIKGASASHAVMGNIAYPVQIPNAEQVLGDLRGLLNCGLELHFEIGELDFQASREGLSYIPSTIDAIKRKLEAVRDALVVKLAEEANDISCLWTRAIHLNARLEQNLWAAAARKYVADTQFALIDLTAISWNRLRRFTFTEAELAAQYNIKITAFSTSKHELAAKNMNPDVQTRTVNDVKVNETYWTIPISSDIYCIEVDTRQGALQRAKYHWRENKASIPTSTSAVYLFSPADKGRPARFKKLMQAMMNPPRQLKASSLDKKPVDRRSARDVAILRLEDKDVNWRHRGSPEAKVWRDAGRADTFDTGKTYYYLPLNGFVMLGKYTHDAKQLACEVEGCGLISVGSIYGVRKVDLPWVQSQKNWINLEDHLVKFFQTISDALIKSMALRMYNDKNGRMEINSRLLNLLSATSPFRQALTQLEGVESQHYNHHALESLVRKYCVNGGRDPLFHAKKIVDGITGNFDRYPMLKLVGSFRGNEQAIANYINMVDQSV
jgi:hypothetical protein